MMTYCPRLRAIATVRTHLYGKGDGGMMRCRLELGVRAPSQPISGQGARGLMAFPPRVGVPDHPIVGHAEGNGDDAMSL